MNITIHRRCRDIDGVTLVQMLARAQERRSKAPLLDNQEVDHPKKESRWWWVAIGLIATYFSVHVLIAIVKGVVE